MYYIYIHVYTRFVNACPQIKYKVCVMMCYVIYNCLANGTHILLFSSLPMLTFQLHRTTLAEQTYLFCWTSPFICPFVVFREVPKINQSASCVACWTHGADLRSNGEAVKLFSLLRFHGHSWFHSQLESGFEWAMSSIFLLDGTVVPTDGHGHGMAWNHQGRRVFPSEASAFARKKWRRALKWWRLTMLVAWARRTDGYLII